jgi:DNA-binding response OmpR family regulator
MYSKSRKPSEIIALQRKVIEEQEGVIAILKGALAAAGGEAAPDYKPCLSGLTPQEQALLGALYRHYPRPVGKYELLELIPGYDHVQERQAQIVNVKVHHVRKKLGEDAIENVRGFGYRLGARQYEVMRGEAAAPGREASGRLRLVEARRAA